MKFVKRNGYGKAPAQLSVNQKNIQRANGVCTCVYTYSCNIINICW